jgi:arylsulfatase A-like enzyme
MRGFAMSSLLPLPLLLLSPVLAPAAPPNVLFISIDDLRPELGCYGASHIQSPNLDRLARTGMVFERAYCQLAICTPSRANVFTGKRPDTLRVWHLREDFRANTPEIVTLPQFLRARGYLTQRMGKVLAPYDPVSWSEPSWRDPARGEFSDSASKYADPRTRGEVQAEYDAAVAAGLTGITFERAARGPAWERADVPDDAYADGRLAEGALTALRTLHSRKQPFFLAVGFFKPHLPFAAPASDWDLYDPASLPPLANDYHPLKAPWFALGRSAEFRGYDGTGVGRLPADEAAHLRHAYYACVSYVDAQVGRLLDELDRLDLSRNTLVVVWGDHGYKLGEHGHWGKSTNVELDTHVPLLVRLPGREAGRRTSALVEFVDLFPTVVEATGHTPPGDLEGISLLPLFANPDLPWKSAAFSQYPRHTEGDETELRAWNLMGRSIRTERFRLTRWDSMKTSGRVEGVELYDHEVDPGENRNLAYEPGFEAIVEDLSRRLDLGWKAALPSTHSASFRQPK